MKSLEGGKFYTVAEAAALLVYSERHVRLLCQLGVFGTKISPRQWLISEKEITLFRKHRPRGHRAGRRRAAR